MLFGQVTFNTYLVIRMSPCSKLADSIMTKLFRFGQQVLWPAPRPKRHTVEIAQSIFVFLPAQLEPTWTEFQSCVAMR